MAIYCRRMNLTGGYEEYAFVAPFYDHVVPYRNRPDVAFFVDAATKSNGRAVERCRRHRGVSALVDAHARRDAHQS
jgi:hypothetical protein